MAEQWRDAVHYRTRADLLRAIAKELGNKEHRRVLNEAALYFDHLAASLERESREKVEGPG